MDWLTVGVSHPEWFDALNGTPPGGAGPHQRPTPQQTAAPATNSGAVTPLRALVWRRLVRAWSRTVGAWTGRSTPWPAPAVRTTHPR
jgi:hypothetical protein